MTKYKVEWLVEDEPTDEEREELLELAQEQVNEEIEVSEMHRQDLICADPSVGLLVVNSALALTNLIKLIRDRDDSRTGIIHADEYGVIHVEELDQDFIEEHNGTHIKQVEGNVNLFATPEDMGDYIEFQAAIQDQEDIDDEEGGEGD